MQSSSFGVGDDGGLTSVTVRVSFDFYVRDIRSYVAHNAGRIDVEPGREVCYGATELGDVFTSLVGR